MFRTNRYLHHGALFAGFLTTLSIPALAAPESAAIPSTASTPSLSPAVEVAALPAANARTVGSAATQVKEVLLPFISQVPVDILDSEIAPAMAPYRTIGWNNVPLVATHPLTPYTRLEVEAIATTLETTTAAKAAPAPAPALVTSSASSNNVQSEADRKLLAELDAELRGAERKLDRAQSQISAGQRELGSVAGTLQQALLQGGANATGLHPFVRVAQRYAGTPYVWGGESARGFDCSGFIIRVMRDLGYSELPHSAAEQFRYGKPIAQGNLQPGDLVFFANTYKPGISHVGIYLGGRRFIHAAGTGLGTIVSSLDQGKYQAKYAGARRLMRVR